MRPIGTVFALAAAMLPGIALASPASDYVAARDGYVAALAADAAAGGSDEDLNATDEKDRADLQARLAAILGPLRFAGLGATPAFAPDTLLEGYIGTGALDGLVFSSEDWEKRLIVTPKPIFENWLATRGAEEGEPEAYRQGAVAALDADALYTSAISNDAAFTRFAALPVAAAGGEVTRAFLGLFAQDVTADATPDTLVVARIAGDRVVIASVPLAAPVPPIPACTKVWEKASAEVEAARQAAEQPGADAALFEEVVRLDTEANDAFRTCFLREAPKQPFIAAATAEAEALLRLTRGE